MARIRLLKHRQIGFVMIEAVIALIILGVIVALVLNSLQLVQAKSRDTHRRDEIDAIASQLETCYTGPCKGSYPSLLQLTDTFPGGFVSSHLTGLSTDNLYDSSAGIIQAGDATAATQYQYSPMPDRCTGIDGALPCSGFTLKAYQETNPDHPYTKQSLHA